MSIVTLGLDPLESKVVTLGYGPDIFIEVTLLAPVRLGRSGKRRKEKEILRIRILDEDGRRFIQEQLIDPDELKNIKIKVREHVVSGHDIAVRITEEKLEVGKPRTIKIKAHETSKRQKPRSSVSSRSRRDNRETDSETSPKGE